MRKVTILGRGPSIKSLRNEVVNDCEHFVLMNDHRATVENETTRNVLKGKKNYIISNIQKTGFSKEVIETIGVEKCIINRLTPDYDLWNTHKGKQRKHSEGGHLNSNDILPFLNEDEPYLYSWRGPPGKNVLGMCTPTGIPIEHMRDNCEKFLKPVYRDKIICNCSFYATLYAINELEATELTYFGVDFYNHLNIKKKWFIDSPKYLSKEWWELRLVYEGIHMKMLWENYLSTMFPQIKFCFYTTDRTFKTGRDNVTINYV